MNHVNLTPSQRQTLTQYLSIVQSSDTQEALAILESTHWNLETALISHYETTPHANDRLNLISNSTSSQRNAVNDNVPSQAEASTFPGGFPGMSSSNIEREAINPAANNTTRSFSDVIQRYLPFLSSIDITSNIRNSDFATLETQSKVIYIIQWIIYVPVLITYQVSSILFVILVKCFPIIRRLAQNRLGRKSEPTGLNPVQTANEFISSFQRYYDRTGELDWFEGGYSNALYVAKRDARFLLCYLHSAEHDDADEFVKEILLNEQFKLLLKEHNVLLWAGDVEKSEGYQASNALEIMKYPSLVLLSLKTSTQETPSGTTTSSPKLSVVSRIQGLIPTEKVIRRLKTQIDKLQPTLITIRTERQQAELSRMIRQQQDQAYQESLAKDQARETAKQEELLKQQRKKGWLEWKLSQMKPECTTPGQFSRIAVRLPSGARIQRCFSKNEETLEDIYTWVELNLQELIAGNEPLQAIDSNVSGPAGSIEYQFGFNLNSIMPRVKIDCDATVPIGQCNGVSPNGNLVVEMLYQ
ncbi:hypothetical protein WICPIJ_007360 [Wickerhamomyces pijperi]|uniref:UBX domain-containing protein n=1 Tax=Wickerhamomyces pijperi TaxID=599730 RepID=A0A9P8Q1Z6_WICPI|nr:hypothetical protein WICPIJ_007360 [Wickerhamomyces pijperi]